MVSWSQTSSRIEMATWQFLSLCMKFLVDATIPQSARILLSSVRNVMDAGTMKPSWSK